MRDYGKVHSTFWSSPTTAPLSDDAKLLALYVLTCAHSTIAGVFRMPDGYVSEDLGWSVERVQQGFAELFANGFANRCETTKWLWIVKHLNWNPPDNPNQRKAAAKVAQAIPDQCAWKPAFMRVCGPLLGLEHAEPANPSRTVPEPFRNQEQEQEQEQKQKTETEGEEATEAGAATAAVRVRKSAKRLPLVDLKTWLETEKAANRKPIPDDDPLFAYADSINLPRDFLHLAWLEFRHKHTTARPDGKPKQYQDWRAAFRDAVRGDYLKLWFLDGKDYVLTSRGQQAKLARERTT